MAESDMARPIDRSLRGRLVFLLKDSFLYGGAAAVSKAFSLITFPLMARHFTVAEYGIIDYFLVLASLLGVFFIFGQDSAVARFFYEYEDTFARRQLITQSLVFQIAGLGILLPPLWVGADWVAQFVIDTDQRTIYFRIVLLQLPSILLINFSQNLLKWTFQRAKFLIMSLGFTIVQASLLLIAVLVFNVGITGVLLVSLATSVFFAVIGLFFVRVWLTRPVDFHYLHEMLLFAIPYGVIGLLATFLPTLERSLTDSLLGAEELGLYAAATKIAMLIGLFVGAFQTAWGPFSFALYKQPDAGQTFNLVFRLFAVLACLAALLISLVAQPLIELLASDRFSSAALAVFPLVMGLVVQATSWITEIGIGISKRSHLSLYAYTAAILATFAGIWFMAPLYGLLGVGYGVLLGHIAKAIIASWMAQRAFPLPWHYRSVILLMAVTLAAGVLSIWVRKNYGIAATNGVLCGSMVFVSLIGWRVLLNQIERKRIISTMLRWLTKHSLLLKSLFLRDC